MRTCTVTAILAACVVSLLTANAFACGESLFRVGKGVAFRQFTAPLPGNIVVVVRSDGDRQLAEELVAAGHDVHVVTTPADIRQTIERNDIDIVLAYFSESDQILAQTADTGIDYLPVAVEGTSEVAESRQLYRRSLTNDDSLRVFLKTIHRTLKARG